MEILGNAYARKVTGRLDLTRGNMEKKIYFFNGLPVYVDSNSKTASLAHCDGLIIQNKVKGDEDRYTGFFD